MKRIKHSFKLVYTISLCLFVFFSASGQWVEEQMIHSAGPNFPFVSSEGELLGYSVDIQNDLAIVGSPKSGIKGNNTGAAFIYRLIDDQWQNESVLIPFDGLALDNFGVAVSINESFAFVGANLDDAGWSLDRGSVYVFENTGSEWIYVEKLTASDASEGDYFGFSIDSNEDQVLIGAIYDDDNGFNSGSAYLFERNGTDWVEIEKLVPDTGLINDYFGTSVSLGQNVCAIGSPKYTANQNSAGAVFIFEDDGTDWIQTQKLIPFMTVGAQDFGNDVSLSGDHLAIGAFHDYENGSESGSVYFFQFDGDQWQQIQKINPDDALPFNEFGHSVAIENDMMLIGSIWDDDIVANSGAIYVYKHNGVSWTLSQKLKADNLEPYMHIGWDVSLSNGKAFLGAPGVMVNGELSGSAYALHLEDEEWLFHQQITNDYGPAQSNFSNAVSINGNHAVVGANLSGKNGTNSGSAYVFEKIGSEWELTQELIPQDISSPDEFGYSLALSGAHIIIGAPYRYENGINSGAAYVYEKIDSEWIMTQKLTPTDLSSYDLFGFSVDIFEDKIILGSPNNGDNGESSGSAYIFQKIDGVWSEIEKLLPNDGGESDFFGSSVSIWQNNVIVGAPLDEDNGTNAGSAYFFRLNDDNWEEIEKVVDEDSSSDYYGRSVAMHNNFCAISASGNALNAGVFTYKKIGAQWTFTQHVQADISNGSGGFGASVDLSDEFLLVGAPLDDDAALNSGSVYIFKNIDENWDQIEKFINPNGLEEDVFGSSVGLSEGHFIVGSPLSDTFGYQAGSAFIYRNQNVSSIEEFVPKRPQLKLFPNPCREFFFVENDAENASLEVYDLYGKLILQETQIRIGLNQINIPHQVATGTYIVRILNSNGISTGKLVIH